MQTLYLRSTYIDTSATHEPEPPVESPLIVSSKSMQEDCKVIGSSSGDYDHEHEVLIISENNIDDFRTDSETNLDMRQR